MQMIFFKYQGTGNDFVILDNFNGQYNDLSREQVRFLCDRRFGIGADGLMLLNRKEGFDFEMRYYNADGGESSMCGNGGRCLVKFAYDRGIMKSDYHFSATDGPHEATIDLDGTVALKMQDVAGMKLQNNHFILNTGSPHYVQMASNVMSLDVFAKGRAIRNSAAFAKEGINVNFVEQTTQPDEIIVRTYERGVEDETLSCGTGVTAAALVCSHNENGFNHVDVLTRGGKLAVEYDKIGERYQNIWLIGPAVKVFEGSMRL